MTKTEQMVYDAVYKPAIEHGSRERIAADEAFQAVKKYNRGQYRKLEKLISEHIAAAKRRRG